MKGLLTIFAASLIGAGSAMAACDAGIKWSTADEIQRGKWRAVTHGNGIFVAVGDDGAIMTSPDGDKWALRAGSAEQDWRDVAFGGGVFAAVAYDPDTPIMTSRDGVTWTEHKHWTMSGGFGSIAYGNGTFVAVSRDAIDGVARSADGDEWTVDNMPRLFSGAGITFADDRFIVVGARNVSTSADGIAWEQGGEGDLEGRFYTVAHGNGRYVAGASEGSWRMSVSTDGGRTWKGVRDRTPIELNFFEGWFFNGATLISKDGVDWKEAGTKPAYFVRSFAYDGSRFVGVGDDYAAHGVCAE